MTETTLPPTSESPFRWRMANRPDTRFGHAAGGVAGLLVVGAIVAFVAAIDNDDPQIPGIAFSVLLIVAAVAAGFWVHGPVRSAAVTSLVLGLPLLWLFAVLGDAGNVKRGDIRIVLLLVVVSYFAMYMLTWTRGRAVFLGGTLLVAANWVIFEIADQRLPFGFGAAEQVQRGFGASPFESDDNSRTVAIIAVVIGAALLVMGAILDRRRASGTATPFLVVGSIYAISGALALGADVDDAYATGIFLALAGLVIGMAATLGGRRATSWLGAIVLLAGASTVVTQATDDAVSGNGGEEVFGAFALVAAAVLLVIGVLTARISGEPIDGGEPIPPRPPKAPKPAPEAVAVAAAAPVATSEAAPAPAEAQPTPDPAPDPAPDPVPPPAATAPVPPAEAPTERVEATPPEAPVEATPVAATPPEAPVEPPADPPAASAPAAPPPADEAE